MPFYAKTAEGILLSVQLQPRSSKDEIVGPHGDALKIKITAPPVDGEANAHACRYLSQMFGLSRSNVTMHKGSRSKHKVFLLQGISEHAFAEIMDSALQRKR